MGYLSSGNEYGGDDVCCMSIEASNGASHGRPNQVFADVELHQCIH